MKIILKIMILAILLSIQLYANIPGDIKYAIQKSKPDQLEKALNNQLLTNDQKNNCLRFATEVLRIRKDKMYKIIDNAKRKSKNGFYAKIGSAFLGTCGIAWFISFMKIISETQDPDTGFGIILAMIL